MTIYGTVNSIDSTAHALSKKLLIGSSWMSALGILDFKSDFNPYESISRTKQARTDTYQTNRGINTKVIGFEPDTASLNLYVVIEKRLDVLTYNMLDKMYQSGEAQRWISANLSINQSYDLGLWIIKGLSLESKTFGQSGLEFEQQIKVDLVKVNDSQLDLIDKSKELISEIF